MTMKTMTMNPAESQPCPGRYARLLLDFSLHENSDRVLFRYDLRERETQELMTDPDRYFQTGRMLSEQEDYRNSS